MWWVFQNAVTTHRTESYPHLFSTLEDHRVHTLIGMVAGALIRLLEAPLLCMLNFLRLLYIPVVNQCAAIRGAQFGRGKPRHLVPAPFLGMETTAALDLDPAFSETLNTTWQLGSSQVSGIDVLGSVLGRNGVLAGGCAACWPQGAMGSHTSGLDLFGNLENSISASHPHIITNCMIRKNSCHEET